MHQYTALYQKGRFHGSDDEFRCAVWLALVSNHGIVEIYTTFRHMWSYPASGSPVAGSYLTRDGSVIGVKDEAELHMLANMYVVELRRQT
jgi:hypothetical protein